MSDDLIDHYTKSGLISDPTKNFRPCDRCGRRCHPDDLRTRDVENYGETIELCERCDIPPEPVGIEGINFDALNLDANTPAHPSPPVDPRFARFGEALWQYIIKRGGDFCRDEISEDILPLAEAAGLCCRVKYDPGAHGDMIDAEPGCEIWWWGNF